MYENTIFLSLGREIPLFKFFLIAVYSSILTVAADDVSNEDMVLADCRAFYFERQFDNAINCVRKKILSGELKTGRDSVKAFELGGIVSFIQDDYDSSKAYFRRILKINSEKNLDPVRVPPEIIELYNSTKAEYGKKHAPSVRSTSITTLLPFGIGHFSENKFARGTVYFGLGVVSLSANIYTYFRRKEMENSEGTYDDPDRALGLYRIQILSFYGGFVGTGLISFLDAAILNRR
ncbi:MAG: hypothetical protein ACLFQK_06660 [Fibrobacterota bacterium]